MREFGRVGTQRFLDQNCPDGLITVMGKNLNIRELWRLEQFCLEQAKLCETSEGRAGLEALAAQYRAALEQATSDRTDQ